MALLIASHMYGKLLTFFTKREKNRKNVISRFSCLFIAALWSPAGKGLTSLLSFVVFYFDFVTFPCGILGQVWYLIVSIPDLCCLS